MRAKPRRKPGLPEPSHRVAIWFAAVAIVTFGAVLGYKYVVGDPRMSWNVASHAERGEFDCLLLGQVREAGFARAVGRTQRRGAQARYRGDVDDSPTPAIAHQGGLPPACTEMAR